MTSALHALAAEAGLLVDWEDAMGRPQTVSDETLRAVLATLELPAGTERQARDSRRALAERRRHDAAGFLTADAGEAVEIPWPQAAGRAVLIFEDGSRQDVTLEPAGGGVRLPPVGRPGYHRLEAGALAATICVAPARAWRPPRPGWGVSVQLYALRAGRGGAFGDFTAAAEFAEAAGRAGADAVAISPVHAPFLADPSRYSPYGPSTRLFLNGLFADPEPVTGTPLRRSPHPEPLVDWAKAWPARVADLRAAFAAFGADHPRRGEFEAFRTAGGEDLEGHARFEALHGHFLRQNGARGWPDWPAAYQDHAGPAVAAFAREHAGEVGFHAFLQWLAAQGLDAAQARARAGGMSIGLIADLAVGMDPGGSHAWSRPRDLLRGLHVGAPPDYFQARGQDWGLAAFSPEALRRTGFEGFLATLRAAMAHAGGVRIDHILGLRRLWLIPTGAEALEGVYLNYPFEDLMRLAVLESQRRRALVIGEDLGTVPEGFRDALAARGLLGLSVLPFERDEDGFTRSSGWRPASVAMTTTHDLPTLTGWWTGRDLDWAARIGAAPKEVARRRTERQAERADLWRAMAKEGCAAGPAPAAADPSPAVDAAVRFVAAAPTPLALLAAEDLLGEPEQPNIPGTMDEHPNWRRRLPVTGPDLFAAPQAAPRIAAMNARRRP
ncbi:MAG: 4-alpha-glucanotransferase [Phenylobacterium sp.]|uniref:4-alpha-glucanotransferase n=1 Tax=Phenylobacterium sp. TaxID=1871053 RepID=UPI00391DF778